MAITLLINTYSKTVFNNKKKKGHNYKSGVLPQVEAKGRHSFCFGFCSRQYRRRQRSDTYLHDACDPLISGKKKKNYTASSIINTIFNIFKIKIL
jgi:hypothetical protein